ncbi:MULTISPECIES: acyl-CoA dehydrogenase family protein [unclassified Acidovorax]|uniref:acyl-CoA dehydrogenase family protein n=1 Tax=unclassified Acidovorax TaxID=2684926 RepID=UPI002882D5A2|nr:MULTISPECIES: acyl-CoA dehydrogenase family protein [unclassified Acidovorax]
MSAVLQMPETDTETPIGESRAAMLDAVRMIANGPLAAMVEEIDRVGTYPEAVMRALGKAGAYRAQTSLDGKPDFVAAIQAISEVSRVCGATGFMMWCQAACTLYMEQSGNPALSGEALERHVSGDSLGGTALSNPMKAMTGIEQMLLKAEKVAGGYVVNGTLPWVSNLGRGHYFGGAATVVDPDGPTHEIMFMVPCDDSAIELRECPSFAGMEGTGTWGVRFCDFFVSADRVIADPVRPFLEKVRASFILLQVGMGLGVTQGAIGTMWDVEQQLGHVNQFLDERPADLQAELDALTERTFALARQIEAGDKVSLLDVLDVRAHASELALRSAQSALLHQGARGYLLSSSVQRRVRESHFVAIVTPALKHLRREMAKLSNPVTPS